jgi:methionine-S-sulfoxide reductase
MRNSVLLLFGAICIAALAVGVPEHNLTPVGSAAGASGCYETAIRAGGCFWSLQESLRHIPGVIRTTVGYTGGTLPNPTYEMVCSGKTGHAEAVQVIFNPAKLSYEDLLNHFFNSHNPTVPPQRLDGLKAQYRSAIFYFTEEQRRIAERVKEEFSKSGKWPEPVVTEITPAGQFYPAEEYHQDYLQNLSCGKK